MKLSRKAKVLVTVLQHDRSYEGDVNDYPSTAVAECLRKKLLVVCQCSRPFKNMRLTPKGQRLVV